eukprot:234606-Rhodomonas_salina.1
MPVLKHASNAAARSLCSYRSVRLVPDIFAGSVFSTVACGWYQALVLQGAYRRMTRQFVPRMVSGRVVATGRCASSSPSWYKHTQRQYCSVVPFAGGLYYRE